MRCLCFDLIVPEIPIAPVIQSTCYNYIPYNRIGGLYPCLMLCSDYPTDMQ
jgi:hypothetical protein